MITDDDLFTVATLVYREWSKAFDNKKACENEKWDKRICPKEDWPQFKAYRKSHANKEFLKWDCLQARLVAVMPKLKEV
jgi:hypothetical protein